MIWLRLVSPATICMAALFGGAPPASADIAISPAVVVFEPGASGRTIIVTNKGKDLVFVTVKVRTVMAPGAAEERLQANPNPAVLGLLATPSRLVLEPGEQRGVRLLPIGPSGDTDRVWRVHIAPAAGPLKHGQSGVAFVIAYDALVIQRPTKPDPDITARRSGKTLTLTNRGNSFAMVTGLEQCLGSQCTKLAGKRLYAGQVWVAELPQADLPVTVTVVGAGGQKRTLRF